MATASVTLSLNQSAFLAGLARARSAVSGLGSSVAGIGARGFVAAGAAVVAFGTAAAYGIKKAFDLGGSLADMSAISGRSVKEILLLRRALEDAGVSMEKIDRFILTGQDRWQVIARALKNMTSADWADAARSVGKQADILARNAGTFDRVSDLLGRATDKLQGFFVGAAGAIGTSLLPILEKFDKMDFASQGAKFGAGLLEGAQALVGFFKKPELIFKTATDYFSAAVLGIGNVFIAVFKSSIAFFRDGMFEAIVAIGSAMLATLLDAFKKPLSYAKTGIALLATGRYVDPNKNEASLGVTAQGFKQQAAEYADLSAAAAKKAAANLNVEDIFGAGDAFRKAQAGVAGAAKIGRNALPAAMTVPEKGAGGFTFVPTSRSTMIDESAFAKSSMASEMDFASRWGGTKPAEEGVGKSSKADQLLEKMTGQLERQNEITTRAFLTE